MGGELYDELALAFPTVWGAGSFLGRYADDFRADFEMALADRVIGHVDSLTILEWLRPMAQFFAKFRPDGTSADLYTRLLVQLAEGGILERSVFASLNYDCLVERAGRGLGFQVAYGSEGEATVLPVLKIHGSANFVTDDLTQWRQYLASRGFHLECGFTTIPPEADVLAELTALFGNLGASYFPVLSLYTEGKESLVCTVRIQDIWNAWADVVSRASALIVIGVRANPQDLHVWNPISTTPAQNVLYVGGAADFPQWKGANDRFELVGTRFDAAFNALCARLLSLPA